jgi:hypothetical protein
MWTVILLAVKWISGSAFNSLATGVVSVINKKADAAVAIHSADVGSGERVDVAQISANVAEMHEQAALAKLRWGWWGTRYLMMAAALPPIIHSGAIYLDSVPFPFVGWGTWWFSINSHVMGSWAVARAPGVYEGQELSIIATVVGILTVQSVGGGIVAAIARRK